MAMIIHNDIDSFNAMIHGLPTQSSISYMQQQAQKVSGLLGQVGDTAKGMFQQVQRQVADYDFGALASRVTNLLGASQVMTHDIMQIARTVEELQNSNYYTQRWTMAHQGLRELYHQGMVSGYVDSYFDHEPTYVGAEHTDYQEVMNGLMQYDDQGSYSVSTNDTYADQEMTDLTALEKSMILANWELVDAVLEHSVEDPSSVFGEQRQD